MTGPEHYRAAEALLVTAADTADSIVDAISDAEAVALQGVVALDVTVAQVHATLALAAATALTIEDANASIGDVEEWEAAVGAAARRAVAAGGAS